jgi:hypothetical protein
MKHEDIIRMAQEAWVLPDAHIPNVLEFANLVAAAERERIIAANAPEIEKVNVYIKALEDAVAAEREACARACDKLGDEYADANAADCAFAIRERGAP